MSHVHATPLLTAEELEGMRPDVEAAARVGFRGDSADTAPAGFIHVMFIVEGMRFSLAAQCAVYRASHHPDDAPLSELMFEVCRDLSTFFMAFINGGIVIQPPAHPAAPPEAGRMVRVGRTWKFEREEGAWRSADREALPIIRLWTLFREW
ncbi:hypothetical protein GSI_07338 [Ganoderma sinense ZZ0214-1]|uniref:Uncharacterized protein n=1 Tax=Ganoderma sinense ZZ0214-1 TaxID=1077348 RepID=A0A2G8SA40_9APHY|nr:hypothetical protein GSI_07338 [Ganoderma sinense ZZ0214-1]